MTRSRSRPRLRVKKTGSCPSCVQEGKDVEIKDERILSPQEPRFLVQDLYNPNDEYVDLESYSEISSVAILGGPTIGALAAETSGEGDQVEESIFLSGGTVSSVQPEDSEPNERTSSDVDGNRQLNIAATVMSWLDNYGQARGCNLGSHGTSLIIQHDDLSRRGSAGSIDMDDEAEVASTQSPAAAVIEKPINDDGTTEDVTTLEAACSMIIKCHNDLEPLQVTIYGDTWKKVQEVLSAWANLVSAVWTRSQEGRITRSELFTFVRLCENLESQALAISPIDASNFVNPVVRNNLGRVQGFINLTLKWCKEIQVTGRIENVNNGKVTSWPDSQKQVFPTVIEQLRSAALAVAKAVLENHAVNCKFPRYEIILEDVVPTRTTSGWVFFGKVELKHLKTDLNIESASSQIVVKSEESALRVVFLSSIPKTVPCVDYGAIFHIVNRASSECSQFYRHATQDFLEAKLTLSVPLLPDSYPKAFANTSQFGQYIMMELIVSHILADQALEPTVTAIDEILRSFGALVILVVKILTRFVKNASNEQPSTLLEEQQDTVETNFKDIIVPMATDSNTLAFRTVRRFMSLGPLNFTSCSGIEDVDEGKSNLNLVHKCLEKGINHLYETPQRNVFSFPHGIQALFAISQLVTTDEFAKNAAIDRPLRALLLDRLSGLRIAHREARDSFERVVGSVDKNIKSAERVIDRIMKKGVTLGVMVPGRASGVSFSHRHGRYILIRYKRNSYIRHQAKRLKQSYELHRHTRKYVVEPDCYGSNSSRTRESVKVEEPMRETR